MRRLRRIVIAPAGSRRCSRLGGLLLYGHARRHPEDVPWTALDLGQPIGAFTGRKLAELADEGPRCRALLDRAGIRYTRSAARARTGRNAATIDAVRFTARRRARHRLSAGRSRHQLRRRRGAGALGMACRAAGGAAPFRTRGGARSTISAAIAAAASTAATRAAGASMPRANAVDIAGFTLERRHAGSSVAARLGAIAGAEGALPARGPRRRLRPVRDRALAGL